MNRARLVRGLLFALLLAQFALVWVGVWLPRPFLGEAGWAEGLLLLVATASTLAAQARQLPGQNVALASLIIVSLAALAQGVGARAAMPFGSLVAPEHLSGQVFQWLPWAAVLWLLALLTSRGVARLILRPWRAASTRGFRVIGLTVLLVVLFDLALEPFATRVEHCWSWHPGNRGLDWYGTPGLNFLARAVMALFILVFATPALLDKKPGVAPPDYHPLFVWLLASLLFATGAVARHLWTAAGLDFLSAIAVTILALRGACDRARA
ncbi:MAG: carotenoid biosynthesis protein [Verrucomicrobiota bacterium]